MKAYEIKNLSDKDIAQKLEEANEEWFNLRFQAQMGQLKDSNRIKAVKKDIARLKTIMRQRQLAGQ
jgi:large subunit ribosomal protein L29